MKEERQKLRDKVVSVFKYNQNVTKFSGMYDFLNTTEWIFDFRKIILTTEFIGLYLDCFWAEFGEMGEFQVCGLETASIVLVSAVVTSAKQKGRSVNGFYVRKSRKKSGLNNIIEGKILENVPIIILDDILNSAKSSEKVSKVLESANRKIDYGFYILRFRDLNYYQHLNIDIKNIFELNDFAQILKIQNLQVPLEKQQESNYVVQWKFTSPNANLNFVLPKSAPILSEDRIYFGSDQGVFWCLNKDSGEPIWQKKVLFGAKDKYIFSTPVVNKDKVFFGAYDGNFHCLDKVTGKKVWTFLEADYIGSSPCVATDLDFVFVGLEFGLKSKQGGVVAIDIKTGNVVWRYYQMQDFTHCSPIYSRKMNLLVCGCNDGFVYAFNARTGESVWKYKTEGEVKAGFCLSDDETNIYFGSFDKFLYSLETKSGKLNWKVQTLEAIYSTPVYYEGKVIIGGLDKFVYCFSEDGEKKWIQQTFARIFATGVVWEKYFVIGGNDGYLKFFNIETGKIDKQILFNERIVNKVVVEENSENKNDTILYVPTVANELYKIFLN